MISLSIIFRDNRDTIKQAIDCVEQYVDEIIAVDTGSEDGSRNIVQSYKKVRVYDFNKNTHPNAFFEDGMIKRFDLARQFGFDKCTKDWILWMDTDDTFDHPESLKQLCKKGDAQEITGWSFKYVYWWDKKTKEIVEEHYKVQLLKNNKSFKWEGWVHEDPIPQYDQTWVRTEDIRRIHWRDVSMYDKNEERNARILQAKLEHEGDNPDPRTMFYYGRSLIATKMYDEALAILQEFVKRSGWDEERWQGYLLIGMIYRDLKKYDEAIEWLLKSLKERPDFPDTYVYLAACYQNIGNHERALYWMENAITKEKPKTSIPLMPQLYTWKTLAMMAESNLILGRFQNAELAIVKARKYHPTSDYLKELEGTIKEAHKRWKTAEAYLTISRFLKGNNQNEKIQALVASTPNELHDDPLILRIRNEATPPKVWDEKSVVIFAYNATEPFSPKSLSEKGIGGSEEAIIYLARELKQLGWRVTVFNWCDNERGTYDGVEYRNHWEFNPFDKFNILVGWRMPAFLDGKFQAKQLYVDLHDVCTPFDFPEKRLKKATNIFVKSKYHRSLFPEVPDDKFIIVGNGIVSGEFRKKEKRNPKRVIYTSAPNRGLDILLDVWTDVKKEVPDAILTPYYGWKSFEEIEKNNPQSLRFMEKMKARMKEMGIEYPRISQKQITKEILSSGIWAYPTHFPEIDCISAKKMQAGGSVPVVANYAALKEHVIWGVKVEGDIYRKDVQEKFKHELIALLKDEKRQEDLRKEMMKPAQDIFAWKHVAQVWHNEFQNNKEVEEQPIIKKSWEQMSKL